MLFCRGLIVPASIWQDPSAVAAANCRLFVRDLIALSPEPRAFIEGVFQSGPAGNQATFRIRSRCSTWVWSKPCSIVRKQNSVKPNLDQAHGYFLIQIVSFFLRASLLTQSKLTLF